MQATEYCLDDDIVGLRVECDHKRPGLYSTSQCSDHLPTVRDGRSINADLICTISFA